MKGKGTRLLVATLALATLVSGTLPVAAHSTKTPGLDGGAVFFGDRDNNKLSDDLDALVQNGASGDRIPVIVVLETRPELDVAAQLGLTPDLFVAKDRWELALNGFSADLTRAEIKAVARSPLVRRVDYDRPVRAYLGSATEWTGVREAWSDWGVCGNRDGNPTSYSKNDVVIAILDTGIHIGHVDLDGGKVIGWKDVVNNQTTPYDDNGHGTLCASIAAGTGEGNANYTGVAPGAALVGVKVLNSSGGGTSSGIVSGINWMVSNKNTYNIRIGSMSLGSDGSSDGTDSVSLAVNNAVANGIIMCVAAGNSGPDRYTIGSPAAAASAITVGAVIDPGELGWALTYFSGRGPTADGRTKPDICAPGYMITAARAGTSSAYWTASGTSMSTPFIAGIIALMLDAEYTLTDSGVKSILYDGANVKDVGNPGQDNESGYGIAIAYNAIKQAGGYSGSWSDGLNWSYYTNNPLPPASDHYYFTVTDASKPIAVTMMVPNWQSPPRYDIDIWLYNPSGVLVASSSIPGRQNLILYQPLVTGEYLLRVDSTGTRGRYWVNISWK